MSDLLLRAAPLSPQSAHPWSWESSWTNSESGGRQLKASAYSDLFACTNGAIMPDRIGVARWLNDLRTTVSCIALLAFRKDVAALFDKLDTVSTL